MVNDGAGPAYPLIAIALVCVPAPVNSYLAVFKLVLVRHAVVILGI